MNANKTKKSTFMDSARKEIFEIIRDLIRMVVNVISSVQLAFDSIKELIEVIKDLLEWFSQTREKNKEKDLQPSLN